MSLGYSLTKPSIRKSCLPLVRSVKLITKSQKMIPPQIADVPMRPARCAEEVSSMLTTIEAPSEANYS